MVPPIYCKSLYRSLFLASIFLFCEYSTNIPIPSCLWLSHVSLCWSRVFSFHRAPPRGRFKRLWRKYTCFPKCWSLSAQVMTPFKSGNCRPLATRSLVSLLLRRPIFISQFKSVDLKTKKLRNPIHTGSGTLLENPKLVRCLLDDLVFANFGESGNRKILIRCFTRNADWHDCAGRL